MGQALGFTAVVALFGAFIYGWIMNIVTLLSDNSAYDTIGQVIIGAVGIFVGPVGAITYYIAG